MNPNHYWELTPQTGLHTFKYRQSSLNTLLNGFFLFAIQLAPNSEYKCSFSPKTMSTGGLHRRSLTGGSAYGILFAKKIPSAKISSLGLRQIHFARAP
tara:strand:- start:1060 stop:1353 length:294 start_codon:yes stop_codon:yes gene_type:complete